MPGTTRVGSYRTLLARPGVTRVVALTAVGRLGYAMLPLLLLFTLRDATDSFTVAATAMAAFGFAGFVMPAMARLIDQRGQRRILPLLAAASSTILVVVASLALAGAWIPDGAWGGFVIALGLSAPPLGPSMRAQWRIIAAPDEVPAAYALDGTVEEMLWLIGPAVAGALLATTTPAVWLFAVAVMLPIGAIGLATSPWRPPPARADAAGVSAAETAGSTAQSLAGCPATQNGGSALRRRRLWPVLIVMLLVGAAGSLTLTSVAAAADEVGRRGLAAAAEVVLGVGAVVGGLAWGAWRRDTHPCPGALALCVVWASALLCLGAAGISPRAIVVLAVAGAASAPLWVLAFVAADDAVPESARTEASTWVTTAANLGTSAGTAMAGWIVSASGASAAIFAASAVAVFAAAGVALGWRSH